MGCNSSHPDDNSGTTATPRQTTTTTAVAAAPGTAHKAHKLTFSSSISSCSVSQPPPHGSLANFPHGDGSWVGEGGTCASSTSAGAHRERTGSNSSSSSNNNNDGSGSAQPQHHQQQPQNQQDLQTLRQRAVKGLKAQQQQQPHARPARVQMRVCDPSGRRLQLDLAPPPPSPLAAAAVAAAAGGGGGGGGGGAQQQQQQLQQQYSSVGGASFARNTTMRLASACTFSTQDSSFSVLDQDMSPRTAGDTHVDFTGAAAAEASWYGAPVTLQPAAREAYPQRPSRPGSAAVATATTGNKAGCRRVAPEGVPSSIVEAPTRDGHAPEEGEEPEEEEEEETEGDDDGATRGGATAASLPSLVEDVTPPHGQVAGEAAAAAAGASHPDVHLGFVTSSTPSSAASIGVDDFHVVIGGS